MDIVFPVLFFFQFTAIYYPFDIIKHSFRLWNVYILDLTFTNLSELTLTCYNWPLGVLTDLQMH